MKRGARNLTSFLLLGALPGMGSKGPPVPNSSLQNPSSGSASAENLQAKIPDPPLVDLAGYKAALAKYKGQPTLVNFWATWCEPCRYEYPMLVELARQYAPQGLVVIGVSFDDDADMNLVRHFLARNRPGFPNFREKPGGNEAAFVHGVDPAWNGSLPATLFYFRDGRRAGLFIGTRSRQVFEQAIRNLLATSPSGSNSRETNSPGK